MFSGVEAVAKILHEIQVRLCDVCGRGRGRTLHCMHISAESTVTGCQSCLLGSQTPPTAAASVSNQAAWVQTISKLVSELDTDRKSVSVSGTAPPKLAIFVVSITAVIVKHGFGLLSVTADTTTKFRPVSDSLTPPRLCC